MKRRRSILEKQRKIEKRHKDTFSKILASFIPSYRNKGGEVEKKEECSV